jgi:hypothetical protein
MAIEFHDLDLELRTTDDIDPQTIADDRNLLIICDDDAAQVGAPCWWAASPSVDVLRQYKADGGTVSRYWLPSWVSADYYPRAALRKA